MAQSLTNQSREVLALATEAARNLQHTYVGTEHILLGLVRESSGTASDVLAMLGVTAERICAEVERLVEPGPEPVVLRTLPLTPRAQHAIEQAGEEAQNFNEKCIAPKHLLLGLLSEEQGVASQVLLNLGVTPKELRAEVFRIRIAQMKIVERAVRPVRASTLRKRVIREELLAHLSAIYEQEKTRLRDPAAALDAAAGRFGEPAGLARELESALPKLERFSHFVERFVSYRAPESAARFSFRMATHTFFLLAVILSLTTFVVFLGYGWTADVETLARVMAAVVLLTPPAQFVAWLAYIKMRDALWGAFGSRKSLVRALMLDAVIALTAMVYLMGVAAAARLDLHVALDAARLCGWMPVLCAIALFCLALTSGPGEIRDTHWALLDIESA
jgi:ClpA/ClpB-like protein